MSEALAQATPEPAPLDTRTLLTRINQRLALLRTWLSHDHGDAPYWWARRTTASRLQTERLALRRVANLLHVERAAARRRIHGRQFETLDAQAAWLAEAAEWLWPHELLQLPAHARLAVLRAGGLAS